jgi:hypothetical protein
MENFSEEFKKRTKRFALWIIKFYQSLPKTGEARIIGDQMLRLVPLLRQIIVLHAGQGLIKNFILKYAP